MCGFAGMVGTTMGLKVGQLYMQNKANAQAYQAKANDAIYEMNNSLSNYEQERQDAYDEAVESIMKTQINALQLNSQVEASVNEEMAGGGRTADQIMRSVSADTARNVASIQDNYKRKSNEIDLNKLSVYKSTRRTTQAYASAAKPNKLADALELVNSFIGVRSNYLDASNERKSGGQK